MEFDVDRHIKTYWDKYIGLTNTNNEEFADATSVNSVRASKFLEGLNLDPIMPEINRYYDVEDGEERFREGLWLRLLSGEISRQLSTTRRQKDA